jgi:hypothetical protein
MTELTCPGCGTLFQRADLRPEDQGKFCCSPGVCPYLANHAHSPRELCVNQKHGLGPPVMTRAQFAFFLKCIRPLKGGPFYLRPGHFAKITVVLDTGVKLTGLEYLQKEAPE